MTEQTRNWIVLTVHAGQINSGDMFTHEIMSGTKDHWEFANGMTLMEFGFLLESYYNQRRASELAEEKRLAELATATAIRTGQVTFINFLDDDFPTLRE